MRRGAHRPGPGMAYANQTDTASDAPGGHSQILHGLCGGPQQDGVEGFLVGACQGSACLRAGAGAQEVRDWEQQTLLVCQPLRGVRVLARGTVAVLPRVRAVMVVVTCLAGGALAAETRGAARRNGVHGPQRRGRHPLAELSPVWRAMEAEEVSQLNQGR